MERPAASLLDRLSDPESWERFYTYCEEGDHMSAGEKKDLRQFIDQQEYLPCTERIAAGVPFPPPKVTELNKKSTGKKRTVFTFPRTENNVLRLLAWCLREYDYLFADSLFSFRPSRTARQAFHRFAAAPGIGGMYSCKLDIHDYFNSVDIPIMLELLAPVRETDFRLFDFLAALLKEPAALRDGEAVSVQKGIMAGVPVSGFLADLYLSELDHSFCDRGILYARYSDDILFFAPDPETLGRYEKEILDFFAARHLEVNPRKTKRTLPGEEWEFLGFSYRDGVIDISQTSLEKIKGKVSRKMRALRRWMRRNQVPPDRVIRAYIRILNRKLFDNPARNEINWCRWYLPEINTTARLEQLDDYIVDCIRSLPVKHHTKARFDLRYETIREYGYRSLVNEYYREKKEKRLRYNKNRG